MVLKESGPIRNGFRLMSAHSVTFSKPAVPWQGMVKLYKGSIFVIM